MSHHGNAEPKIGSAPTQTPNLDPVSTSEFTAKYESLLERGDGPEMGNPYTDGTTFSERQGWKSPNGWVKDEANRLKDDIYHVYDDSVRSADIPDRMHLYDDDNSASAPERSRSRISWRKKAGAIAVGVAFSVSGFLGINHNTGQESTGPQAVATAPELAPAVEKSPGLINSRLLEEHPLDGSLDMAGISSRLTAAEKDAAQVTENGYEVTPLFKADMGHDGDIFGASSTLALTEQDNLTLYNTVQRNASLMTYLFKSGKIDEIRFSVANHPEDFTEAGADGDMRISPREISDAGVETPGYIAYVLPAQGEVTAQAISVLLHHEASHLIQRDIDVVDKFPGSGKKELLSGNVDANNGEYERLCRDVRTSALAVAQQDPTVIEAAQQVLDSNTGYGNPKSLKAMEVAQAILNGTFVDWQPTSNAPKPAVGKDYVIDECKVVGPGRFVFPFEGVTDDTLTTEQLDALKKLEPAMYEAMYQPASPLSVFKESNYLRTAKGDGHPELTPELLASAYNIMMKYPAEFVRNVQALRPTDQQTVIILANTVMTDTIRANKDKSGAETLVQESQQTIDWINAEFAKANEAAGDTTPTR